jgi:hypothetical protein
VSLPKPDQFPFIGSGNRIFVLPTQEAQSIRALKLIYRCWIPPKLAVIKLDGARVLLAPVDQLFFAFPLDCGFQRWDSNGQANNQNCDHEQDADEDVSALS